MNKVDLTDKDFDDINTVGFVCPTSDKLRIEVCKTRKFEVSFIESITITKGCNLNKEELKDE